MRQGTAWTWCGLPTVAGGAAERSFLLDRGDPLGPIPGVLWLTEPSDTPPPVVLLGHGGSGHKRSDLVLAHARWFTRVGIIAIAIDGPHHGDRPRTSAGGSYQRHVAQLGAEAVTNSMVADWQAVLEGVAELAVADAAHLGYVGMSMGTRYGLPLAAALGTRLTCAVLGKFGLEQGVDLPPALDTSERIRRDAPAVTAATLFHVQEGDGVFPLDGQLDLFSLLGSANKQLLAYPGAHELSPPSAVRQWRRFTAQQLRPDAHI